MKENVKNTTNSSVYKKLLIDKLSSKEGKCGYCPLHRGCNRYKGGHSDSRSWKVYRSSQWK